ncbi:hypothetical protein Ancab_032848 [Ancistrocladus abbreviatus]
MEDANHRLLQCRHTWEVWMLCVNWWGMRLALLNGCLFQVMFGRWLPALARKALLALLLALSSALLLPGRSGPSLIEVERGDVIITGTDGLFDNVYASEIEAVVKQTALEQGRTPKNLACAIAEYAFNAVDRDIVSPFSEACRKAGISNSGRKMDDVTVIVSYILPTFSL